MRSAFLRPRVHKRKDESGQTILLAVLVLGLFLLGAVALSVDVSNWWYHRQIAQGAADAACTAGVMDMLVSASGGASTGLPAGSPPAAFSCSSNAGSSPCQYAALNGYDGAGLVAGQASNDVEISFPTDLPSGVGYCGTPPVPPCIDPSIANPIIRADVIDRAPTSFSALLSGLGTRDITASAKCGILQDTSPVPIIVLNPTCPHAFQLSGNTNVSIVGGPTRSVQVNSDNTSCAAATSNAANQCNQNGPTIDLSHGGPNFSGSDFGVTGLPKTAPTGFNPGMSGTWSTSAPIIDPFANVAAPLIPSPSTTNSIANASRTTQLAQAGVAYNTHGCPDTAGCVLFQPGLYTNPIIVKQVTAIFVPGVYYVQGVTNDNASSPGSGCVSPPTGQGRYGLDVDSTGVVRPSTDTGDGSSGITFYFSGLSGAGSYGSVFFGSNAGKPGGRTIDTYTTANAVCTGGSPPPPQLNLPATIAGNVLLGPCTTKGTYIGATGETVGPVRGLLFFQDRANGDAKGQPSMQGGGGLVVSGNMYFHNCNNAGTGTSCTATPNGYKAFYNLQGTPGGNAYILGNITTDELVLGGGGNIAMSLNPNAVYNIYKASLLQ